MSAAIAEPMSNGSRWIPRTITILSALAIGAAVIVLNRASPAIRLNGQDAQLIVGPSQALALYNLRAAPVLQVDGAPSGDLSVTASTARFTLATRKRLAELRVKLPNVKGGQVVWQARPADQAGARLRLSNGRQWPDAGMIMRPGGGNGGAELRILAAQTSLTLDLPQAGAQLQFAGADLTQAVAATPIQLEIPPGETVTLAFNANRAPAIRLGDPLNRNEPADRLPLGRAEVGLPSANPASPRLKSVDQGICASPTAGLLLKDTIEPGDCRLGSSPAGDRLAASQLRVEPSRLAISLQGDAVVTSEARAVHRGLSSTVRNNKLVAVAFVALVLTLIWSLWRLRWGRGM